MRSKQQPRPSYRWINDREENGKQPTSHKYWKLISVAWKYGKIQIEISTCGWIWKWNPSEKLEIWFLVYLGISDE